MKILITGGTGFIGKHLVTRLKKEGHNLFLLVRPGPFEKSEDIQYFEDSSIENLISFMQREKFDGIVHLASVFLAKHEPKDIQALIESNVHYPLKVLEAATKSEVKWFINTGTFWQHYQSKKYSPVNLYAATKQAFEDIAAYYIETKAINFATLKLNDTFGPGDTRSKIMNLFVKIAESGQTLEMSPGKQMMDISYIDNVIDAYAKLISLISMDTRLKLNGKSFAVKSAKRLSLRELAKTFENVTGNKLNIAWGKREYRMREVMMPWNAGKVVPGWKPKVGLEDGIRRTFDHG